MKNLMHLLKNIVAKIANMFRKVYNFPIHVYMFIKNMWRYWWTQFEQIWQMSELVEILETIKIGFALLIQAFVSSLEHVKRKISVVNKIRYQLAMAGSGSWIDRIIYTDRI